MSSPLNAPLPASKDVLALQSINSAKQSYANKDFVKNIAWLNQSVDTLALWNANLQSGVDEANQGILEGITAFIGDVFAVFAGGEPTGVELGDLKYILQGIGAFFGINPDTPFPLNLVEMAQSILENMFAPLPQFTDLVFDAIEAWAVDLGFDDEVVVAAEALRDAINDWGEGLFNFFNAFSDTITGLLELLGFGRPPAGVDWFGQLIQGILDVLNDLIEGPRQALLWVLSQLIIIIFNALTFILSITSPNNLFNQVKIDYVGSNLITPISAKTTEWSVGVNANTGWVYNSTYSSLDTNGTGAVKTVVTQSFTPCTAGNKLSLSAELKWTSIPASTQFGVFIAWYADDTQIDRTDLNIDVTHSASGGWSPVSTEVTVPNNANFFRVGAYVGTGISTGNVSVKNIKVLAQGPVGETIFSGLTTFIDGFLSIFDPLNASYLFGTPQKGFFDLIPASVISWEDSGNLLENPNFDNTTEISGGEDWVQDPETTHGTDENAGSVKVIADGYDHELYSNAINVVEHHALSLNVWVKWEALMSSGDSIKLRVAEFDSETSEEPINIVNVDTFTVTGTSDWQNLDGVYHTPAGVTQIRMVLHVSGTANSGTVWFSDGFWQKNLVAGLMPKSWTDGLDDLNDSVEGFWGDFWDAVFGGDGSGKTAADAAIAAAAQANTITGSTSVMLQVLAALGNGTPDADDFERWDLLGIGTKWAAYSSAAGGLTISDAHNVQWISSFDAEYVAYSNVSALTSIQSSTIILGTAPEKRQSQSLVAWNSIWLRCTAFTSWATRTGLRCDFTADQTLELWWFLNGVGTMLFQKPLPNLPVKGSVCEFTAGTIDDPYQMTARFNGAVVLDEIDSDNVSTYGPTQLRRGFGGYHDAGFLLEANCGKVKQWTAVG